MPEFDKDPFQVLGVKQTASRKEVRDRYLLLVRVCHPDRFDRHRQAAEWAAANEMLRDLNEAYAQICDPRRSNASDSTCADDSTPHSATNQSTSNRNAHDSTNNEAGTRASKEDGPSSATHTESSQEGMYQKGVLLKWSNLSDSVRNALLDLQRSHNTAGVWSHELIVKGSLAFRLSVFASAAAMSIWWAESGDRNEISVLIFGGLFLGIYELIVVSRYLWRCYKGPMRPRLYLTEKHIIRAFGDRVWVWPLWAIKQVKRKDGDYAGQFDHSLMTFQMADIAHSIRIYKHARVISLNRVYTAGISRAQAEASRGNSEYFEDNILLSAVREAARKGGSRKLLKDKWRISLVPVIASVITVACVARPFLQWQDYNIDTREWTNARAINTARAVREYLHSRPAGRYASAAEASLNAIYNKAATDYAGSASQIGNDAQARRLILSMMEYARRSGQYNVGIYFDRTNEIPLNIENSMRKVFGVSNILPVGNAFSELNMKAREHTIANRLVTAFGHVIPNDVLSFEVDRSPLPELWIVVSYSVNPGESLYFDTKEATLPKEERSYYPGIEFRWRMEFCGGLSTRKYAFTLVSNPASQITVEGGRSTEASNVYDAMSVSAFDSLRVEIEKRIGLPSDTSTPESSVKGN